VYKYNGIEMFVYSFFDISLGIVVAQLLFPVSAFGKGRFASLAAISAHPRISSSLLSTSTA
jgi:hypothetical protein